MRKRNCKICRFMKSHRAFGLESEWLAFVREGTFSYNALGTWLKIKGLSVSKRTIQRHIIYDTPNDYQIRKLNQLNRKLSKKKTPLVLEQEARKYTLSELGYGVRKRRGKNEGLR